MNPADASIRRSPATETPAKSLNSADRRNGESDVFLDGESRSVDQNKKTDNITLSANKNHKTILEGHLV